MTPNFLICVLAAMLLAELSWLGRVELALFALEGDTETFQVVDRCNDCDSFFADDGGAFFTDHCDVVHMCVLFAEPADGCWPGATCPFLCDCVALIVLYTSSGFGDCRSRTAGVFLCCDNTLGDFRPESEAGGRGGERCGHG